MFAAFEDSWMKKLFDFPSVVIDMLRGLMPPEVVDACDFREMEQLSTQYVDDGLSQSFGDAAWRVRFRLAGAEGWLYLLLVLEFQSTVDSDMASACVCRSVAPEAPPERRVAEGRPAAAGVADSDLHRPTALDCGDGIACGAAGRLSGGVSAAAALFSD